MRSAWFILLFAVMVSAPLRVASAQPVTTRPAVAPATRPSIDQLHAQAYQLMRAGQYQKAAVPLEQAYRTKPAAEQSRALILNHALLDVMQKVNAVRAIKDLRDYLRLHPNEPDEQATNLLGAALQLAGKNPRLAQNDLYLAAVKQLQQSVEALEQTRPGEHKWGPKWYSDADFTRIRFKLDETIGQWRFQQDQADRLKSDWQAAQAEVQRYNVINVVPQHNHANPADAVFCPICQGQP